jgi:hypothetical protein
MNKILASSILVLIFVLSYSTSALADGTNVTISHPRIIDIANNPITGHVHAGQQVIVVANLANNQNFDQPFAFVVQIKDSKGVTVDLSWITGTLLANQTLSPAQSWTPTIPGSYSAHIYVFQSINNPVELANPAVIKFIVDGGKHHNYKTDNVIIAGTLNPPFLTGTAILEIFGPDNNLVQIARTNVDTNGKFSHTIKAGGPLFTFPGNYSVRVQEGQNSKDFLSFICKSVSPINCSAKSTDISTLEIVVKLTGITPKTGPLNMNVTLLQDKTLIPITWIDHNVTNPSNGQLVKWIFNNPPANAGQYFVCSMEIKNTTRNGCTLYPISQTHVTFFVN